MTNGGGSSPFGFAIVDSFAAESGFFVTFVAGFFATLRAGSSSDSTSLVMLSHLE